MSYNFEYIIFDLSTLFLCVCVLLSCMSVHFMAIWRPKEGIISSRTRMIVGCCVGTGTKSRNLWKSRQYS